MTTPVKMTWKRILFISPLIKLPVLVLHGTEDKATNPKGSQFFYDNAGSTDKTLKLYEGHYHDLLNDLDKEIVMADIHNWIDARVHVMQPNPWHSDEFGFQLQEDFNNELLFAFV